LFDGFDGSIAHQKTTKNPSRVVEGLLEKNQLISSSISLPFLLSLPISLLSLLFSLLAFFCIDYYTRASLSTNQ